MSYHDESGDVLGLEVFIVYTSKEYYAIVQGAEGVPGVPVLVPAIINNHKIKFTIPDTPNHIGYSGDFLGEITLKGLKGKFKGIDEEIYLPRNISYWQ